MTERIYLEQVLVEGSTRLNPVELLTVVKGSKTQQRAKFKTSLVAHYIPNVPTSTPGQVYIAYSQRPPTGSPPIACQPIYTGPVWKKASFLVKKSLLQNVDWVTLNEESPWLVCHGHRGSITITCTILALQYSTIPPEPVPQLEDIDTEAWAGPILAGFSLVFYGSDMPQTHAGGVCLTIDLRNGKGYMTSNLYIRTPETKPYLCVRYGTFPSGCTFTYNSANSGLSWKSNSHVIYSVATISSNLGYIPNYYASWTPIRGSTNWWMETRAGSYKIEGAGGNAWRPYNMLYLYYDYGDVNIFSSTFVPSYTILPSNEQPVPSPGFKPGETRQLPLNVGKNVNLVSKWWNLSKNPKYGSEIDLLNTLTELKQQIVEWPVNDTTKRAIELHSYATEHPEEKSLGLPRVRDDGP